MYTYTAYPDYRKSIVNIPNSILKYFGVETVGETLPDLDKYLNKEYKNIILLVLDGVGQTVLDWNLNRKYTLIRHERTTVSSVFPSATVAATTSLITGQMPCEHAWLGWDTYYKELGENVTVYNNTLQCSKKQAAKYKVAETLTPYKSVTERLIEAGVSAYILSPFADPMPGSFSEIMDMAKELCAKPGRKYIYAYWDKTDEILHKFGGASNEEEHIKSCLIDIEKQIAEFTYNMKDTLFIITADHGHIDCKLTCIKDHPELTDCLVRLPSLEPRLLNFFVKKGRKREFRSLFKKIYGDEFRLMTKKKVLDEKLFGTGTEHKKFRSMLGDYFAVATGDSGISINKPKWISTHGGVNSAEMRVPLIIINDFFTHGTDVENYINAAFDILKKKYPWTEKSMFNPHYSYAIEKRDGRKKFIQYYTWDNGEKKDYDDGWDGELFINTIVQDHETGIQYANEVEKVFDVRPDYGVDAHGWKLECFEFRLHKLGGYSAFVQAGDRVAGGSRTFFFSPEEMSGTFEEFLAANKELLSGAFGLTADYMRNFAGLKEFLGFRE